MVRNSRLIVWNQRGFCWAALGFPDEIFIVDADKMSFIKKIKIENRVGNKNPTLIGTFSPSLDGEKLYVQITKSFQIVDIHTEIPDMKINHSYYCTCSNHMQTSADTDW